MSKHFATLIFSLALFVLTASLLANSQAKTGVTILAQAQPMSPWMMDANSPNTAEQKLQQAQISRLFSARQAQLRIDTAKLVELTAQLKQQVDKANVNILSMDVVKKAQEIQKLAKSVQDKMKNAY
jgi:spore coat polysaccharide biosynthesis protein SpsF (cytidylyltransferase family)